MLHQRQQTKYPIDMDLLVNEHALVNSYHNIIKSYNAPSIQVNRNDENHKNRPINENDGNTDEPGNEHTTHVGYDSDDSVSLVDDPPPVTSSPSFSQEPSSSSLLTCQQPRQTSQLTSTHAISDHHREQQLQQQQQNIKIIQAQVPITTTDGADGTTTTPSTASRVIQSEFHLSSENQPFNYPPLPQSIIENEALMGVLHSWYYCGYQTGLFDGYQQGVASIQRGQQQRINVGGEMASTANVDGTLSMNDRNESPVKS